jgi:D-3-phosphoglycerate dehydrogenase
LIGRGGVGMDNIDVEYATDNGLHVINTPAASSSSVAELVFAHLFGMVRFLHSSNREMPLEGDSRFKELKKAYSQGIELRGKTLGIIGFGKIGQEVAKIGLGLGMNVIATDGHVETAPISIDFFNGQKITINIDTVSKDELIKEADFITLHVPSQDGYLIAANEIEKMKDGVGIINVARGGVLNEVDLVKAIESGKIQFAGLDVFETEPTPAVQLLMNPEISLTPHIGAATKEAQDRIGTELASQIIALLKN